MRLRHLGPSAALLAALAGPSSAFYLPGVAPTSYKPGDRVALHVNNVKPIGNPKDRGALHSVLSYEYYHPLFNFCTPEEGYSSVPESLGSILFGDRIMTSPFELKMAVNETCKPLC